MAFHDSQVTVTPCVMFFAQPSQVVLVYKSIRCLPSFALPSASDNQRQPPFSPMYSAKPGFPRPSRQKQIPSSQSARCPVAGYAMRAEASQ